MPEIVAEIAEGATYGIQYRLWRDHATAVEPIATFPLALWAQANDEQRAAIRDAAVAYSRMHYPTLSDERPDAPAQPDADETQPNEDGGTTDGDEPTGTDTGASESAAGSGDTGSDDPSADRTDAPR